LQHFQKSLQYCKVANCAKGIPSRTKYLKRAVFEVCNFEKFETPQEFFNVFKVAKMGGIGVVLARKVRD